MKLRHLFNILAAVTVLALVVAACGGGDDDTPTAVPATAVPATAVPATMAPDATAAPEATAAPAATRAAPAPAATATPTAEAMMMPKTEPKYGGTVVMGSQTTNSATGLIPPYPVRPAARSSSITISNNVYNNLMIKDPFGDPPHTNVEGHLAVEWDIGGNGTTVTLKLREGVTWHDGEAFTAEDVVHTVNAFSYPPEGWRSDFQGLFLSRIASTEAVDDYTVKFTTYRPSAFFFDLLTETRAQMIPAHIPDLEVLIADPVGTGPWMHDRTDLNVETVLVKNPNYFRTDPEGRALPFLDGMTWTQFTGFELWLAALKTGQTQMVDHFHGPQLGPPEVREDLANAVPGIVFDYYIQTQYGVIFANRPPFDDARVREAIFLWLDRKQILDLDTGGVGSVFGSGVTPTDLGGRWGLPEVEIYNWPGLRYVDASGKTVLSAEEFQAKRDELQKHPDDLARAKELLAEAGIAPGSFSTTIIVQGGGVQDRVGPVVAQQLSELFESSWELKISTDASVFWTQHIFQGDWEGIAWGNHGAAGLDDPQSLTEDGGWISTSFWYGAPGSFIPWSGFEPNPTIDSLYAEQDAVVGNIDARRDLIHSLQREVLRHHVRIISHLPKSPGAHHPEIMDRPASGDVLGTTNRTNNWMYDRMWLDI